VAVLLAELGHRVVGVDLSAVMVEAAKAKAVTHNVPGARFFVGNASDPDLASNSLDAIVVRHVMWTLPDVPRAIERWTRCLRAGGVLVMVEGRWSTGTGITAERLGEQVRPMLRDVVVRPLPDPRLWGGSMVDERYMVVGRH
jgi:SAM-dependent methyltransferase